MDADVGWLLINSNPWIIRWRNTNKNICSKNHSTCQHLCTQWKSLNIPTNLLKKYRNTTVVHDRKVRSREAWSKNQQRFSSEHLDLASARWHIAFSRYTSAVRRVSGGLCAVVPYHRLQRCNIYVLSLVAPDNHQRMYQCGNTADARILDRVLLCYRREKERPEKLILVIAIS